MTHLTTFSSLNSVISSGAERSISQNQYNYGFIVLLYLSFITYCIPASPAIAGLPRPGDKGTLPKAAVGNITASQGASTFACPTVAFTVPSAAAVTQCANTTMNLTVSTTAKGPDAIKFVYFTSPLTTATDAYTAAGGTVLGTVISGTATTNTVSLNNVQLPDNVGTTTKLIYVYALLEAADGICKVPDSFTLTLNPRPAVVIGGDAIFCQGTTTQLTALGVSGGTYQWYWNGGTTPISTANPVNTTAINTTTTYQVRATLAGCVSDLVSYTLTPVVCTSCAATPTSVGGVAYRDFGSDGAQGANDPGLSNITITLFRCDASNQSTQVAQMQTDINGAYSFTGLTPGTDYRVEFTNLPAGTQPTYRGTQNGTTVQFTKPGSCSISLGINYPSDFCQANPKVVVPCYENGTGTGSIQPGFVSFDYGTGTKRADGTIGEVGSVWGVAYQRTARKAFTSAFLKRHVGFAAQGPGGIYVYDYANPAVTAPLVASFSLQGVTPANGGAAIDLGSVTRVTSPATDPNYIATSRTSSNYDIDAFAKVGKMSYGDADVDETNNRLWLVNLYQRAIISLNIGGSVTSLNGASAASLTPLANQYLIDNLPGVPSCGTDGVFRPWALAFHRGKGYLGGVCSSETSKDPSKMVSYVLEFDPDNVGAGFTTIMSVPMTYPREQLEGINPAQTYRVNASWRAWLNAYADIPGAPASPGRLGWPQPILSDIAFADNGDMVMGFTDRLSHQWGMGNYLPVAGSTVLTEMGAGGDILHACFVNGKWLLEGTAGSCKTNDMLNNSGYFLANDGPSKTGEFYPNDYFNDGTNSHYETANGGLVILPGRNEVITTAFDITSIFQQGVKYFNTTTGANNPGSFAIIPNTNGVTSFGKGNGLGDLEITCDLAPIQIGNRVWRDDNSNGIQDPCEPAIPGAVVKLYDAAKTTVIASATTNATGEYYFSSAATVAGTSTSAVSTSLLTYNTNYALVMTSLGTSTVVTGLSLTSLTPLTLGESGATNTGTTLANNDAKLDVVGGINSPTILLTTGDLGESNHTYDFGITVPPCVKPTLATIASQSICQGATFSFPLVSKVVSNTVTSLQWYTTNAAGTSFTVISGATSLSLTSAQAVAPTTGGQKFYALVGQNGLSALCSDTVFVNLYMKPTQTISFVTPAAATVTQCANTTISMSVTTNAKAPDAIRFVYFTSPLASAADAYTATGGTVLGTVNSGTLASNTVALNNVQLPDFIGGTAQTWYVYAILESADGLCLPSDQFTLTLNPRPDVGLAGPALVCKGTTAVLTGSGSYAATQYAWYANNNLTTALASGSVYSTTAINTTTTFTIRGISAGGCTTYASFTVTPVICTPCTSSSTSLGGTAFADFNSDGTKSTNEDGIGNVTVTIFKCDASGSSTQVATMPTDINGQYSFTGLTAGTTYRVEFSNLPAGYSPTYQGTNNGTMVQFTKPGSCSVNVGLNQPGDYCQSNPPLLTSCYVTLAASVTSLPADVVVSFPYDFSNAEKTMAVKTQVGSVWGVAYDKINKKVYTSAFLKRGSAMGPGGLGAIYITDPNAASANASLFFDLGTVDNVGASLIDVSDAARGLPTSTTNSGIADNKAADLIGKVGLGGIDVTDDGAYVYTISLASKKVWRIPTSNPTSTNVTSWSITNLPKWDLTKGNYRPFAIKYHNDKVYVGVTFDAELSSKSYLAASVYELDPATGVFKEVITFPMSYAHGNANGSNPDNGFYPWTSSPPRLFDNVYVMYPQPLFSDIEFDTDGTATLGFFDRSGHQLGPGIFLPNTTNGAGVQVAGEVLRMGVNPSNRTPYILEAFGRVIDKNGASFMGQLDSQGPDGAEFYSGDTFSTHEETSLGGVAIKPGSGEAIISSMDPSALFNSGYIALSQTTGGKTRSLNITTLSFKGNGLGDVELACDQAPIQIGNRVWRDDNSNGIQDPCEPAIPGAVVKLYDATKTTVIASATTNAAGEYYFASVASSTVVSTSAVSTSLLTYNTTYGLVITSLGTSSVATGLTLTDVSPVTPGESGAGSSAAINSGTSQVNNDAKVDVVGGLSLPCIKLTTGGPGESNHTYDFGIVKFVCNITATAQASSPTVCTGQPVTATALASPVGSYTYVWSAPAGVVLTGGNTATATATASVAGLQTFTVTVSSSPTCFTTAVVSVSAVVCKIPSASLGDYVFVDKNKNGIQDADETPMPGVVVTLYQNGSLVATTTTDASGLYSFTGLTPGTSNSYVVGFTAPAGYTATTPLSGTDATKDSNADPITGRTAAVTLAPGENNPTIDAGFYLLPASLGNYVWFDTNGNGQQDPTESGVSSVTAVLCDAVSGSVVSTTVTDATGKYLFTNLNPGSYIVKFTTPSGTTFTSGNTGGDGSDSDVSSLTGNTGSTGVYSLSAGEQNLSVAAGIKPLTAGLGDYVFEDVNANGQQDVGDKPIPGVTVSLLSSGTLVTATTTDASGFYSFTGLTPGVPYSVSFSAPAGFTATSQNTGADATDSDGNPATGLTGTYSLTANEFNNTVDMGYHKPVTGAPAYAIAKTVDLNRTVKGGIVTYTVSLTNTGNATGTNLTVGDQLSTTAISYIGSATASTGTFTPSGNSGTWTIVSLAPGQVATLFLRVQLNAEGITYNKATAPNGQTATVCTSVPFKVCANETFQINLAVPAGYAPYQWSKDGQPIAGATSNVLSVTALGEYSVVGSTTGSCPNGSCCPFIIEPNPVPSLTAVATAATCTGNIPLNDARITLVGSSTNAVSYNITMGNSFTASSPLFVTNQSLTTVVGGVLKSGLANPASALGQAYTIRVYTADGCYADTVVTIQPARCDCPPPVCVPIQVKRLR